MLNKNEDEIMKSWDREKYPDIMVSIKCLTYKHEKYISQTLDGFLMQITEFPFEVVVHDDASTDKTQDIIKEYEAKYPNIIKPIYETENQYSKPNGSVNNIVVPYLLGKYIATCEGDDYWIDENKLQMQVDFLENNQDYGMCYTRAKKYLQTKNELLNKTFGNSSCGFNELLFKGNCIPTLTTCVRRDLFFKYWEEIQPGTRNWLMGDYPMWLYFSKNSKVKFFDKETAVYRVLQDSASHFNNFAKRERFINSTFDIKDFYIEKYSLGTQLTNDRLLSLATSAFIYDESELAKKYLLEIRKIKGLKNKIKLFVLKNDFLRRIYLKRLKH